MATESIVIVGAGHSGTKAAAALRKHGWSGTITLVGEEPHIPYDRPPLSKAVLLGKKSSDQCAFFPGQWYHDNGIGLLLEEPVQGIERQLKRVRLSDGRELPYDKLLIATGSALNPLTLEGSALEGVWPLRTPRHADAIAHSIRSGQTLVVIGAGVIGLEVAAAAVQLGCRVHVLELAKQAMGRGVPLEISAKLVAEHLNRGVDIRLGVRATALEGDGRVSGVRLEDGELIPCDLVVYGIGVRPRTELAEAAGLPVQDGVVTNRYLQTDDPNIYACGDVCRYDSALFGELTRHENWRNSEAQADTAARNMLGQNAVFSEVPWFWSNQYELALQVAGLATSTCRSIAKTAGRTSVLLSVDPTGTLRGAAALGPLGEVAACIRMLKGSIALEATVDDAAAECPEARLEDLIPAK